MNHAAPITIDEDRCTGCGLCTAVCPSQTIALEEGKAKIVGSQCMACTHCMAACPTEAITISAIDENALVFATFKENNRWLPPGTYDTAQLVRLMRSRRSCRNYADTPVERAVLDDLVKIGITAPSGTNSQRWTFTILPTRREVTALGDRIGAYFKRLNSLAEKAFLRNLLKLLGKTDLDEYYQRYFQTTQEALHEWEHHGRDRLFHGASAAIVIGSRPGASCPAEDALLATQNILLAAHSMGLGTCLIGFAVEAMKRDESIKAFLRIPSEEEVFSVIALGYPKERYFRLTGRKKPLCRYFDLPGDYKQD